MIYSCVTFLWFYQPDFNIYIEHICNLRFTICFFSLYSLHWRFTDLLTQTWDKANVEVQHIQGKGLSQFFKVLEGIF